jgi:hypothetical protein
VTLRQYKHDKNQSRFKIYLTAVNLMARLADLEPHLPRAYKFTLGRLLLDWSATLVYRIDRMMMMRGDKREALENIAATARTIEAIFKKLVECHALPNTSKETEAETVLMLQDIEEQARALWKKTNEKYNNNAGTCSGQGSAG